MSLLGLTYISMDNPETSYSLELQNSFLNENWMENPIYSQLNLKVIEDFRQMQCEKESFTYLLLDPRITKNLRQKCRSEEEPFGVIWSTFIKSIFYVGKGRSSRGYSHFKEALILQKQGINISTNKKIQKILDIWSANSGVLVLHIFQNISSEEAHTYEAAMIDVVGLTNLTNLQRGTYYSNAINFTPTEQRMLGLYKLYKALIIHIHEGERGIRPENV